MWRLTNCRAPRAAVRSQRVHDEQACLERQNASRSREGGGRALAHLVRRAVDVGRLGAHRAHKRLRHRESGARGKVSRPPRSLRPVRNVRLGAARTLNGVPPRAAVRTERAARPATVAARIPRPSILKRVRLRGWPKARSRADLRCVINATIQGYKRAEKLSSKQRHRASWSPAAMSIGGARGGNSHDMAEAAALRLTPQRSVVIHIDLVRAGRRGGCTVPIE